MSPLMIGLIAVFAILFIGAIGRGLFVWMRNNNSPVENVNAKVVSKRMKVTGHGAHRVGSVSSMNMTGSTYTDYFVTFELEGGKRLELRMKESQFGLLAENDSGTLSYQGTRFLDFQRN